MAWSRMVSIRQLTNGSEVSFRRFVWCGDEICEERDAAGAVTKRFFRKGMKVESGSDDRRCISTPAIISVPVRN